MDSALYDRTLALAGIFQAVQLVQRAARFGSANGPHYTRCIQAIFALDPDTAESVYGGLQGVERGLKLLRDQLGSDAQARDIELTKYAVQLLYLERRLSRDCAMLLHLRQGITEVLPLARATAVTDAQVIARLADLYSRTVSTLSPRILVNGEQQYLSNPTIANQIRALLLAGMRSAVLWRQRGGNRWRLLWERGKLFDTANTLLEAPRSVAE